MFNTYEEPSLGKTAKAVLITVAITAITNHLVAWVTEELRNKFGSKAKEAKQSKQTPAVESPAVDSKSVN